MAMTYEEVLRRLGRRVSVQVDKRRGTEIRRAPGEAGEAGDIQIRYRGTPVVTLHPDHTYTLRTGGLATRTVRNRIAEYSPVSLVHRGGGYFMEDVQTGALVPFMEGVRVGPDGRAVEPATPRRIEGTAQQLDEARLRAFIRRVVAETLRDFGVPPRPVQAATTRLRSASLRATATPLEEGATLVPLDVVEKILIAAGVSPEKARKTLRETRAAYFRGRDKEEQANDNPGHGYADEEEVEPMREPPKIGGLGNCRDCGLNLAAHYDRANRYRGCDYAHEHREDVGLV